MEALSDQRLRHSFSQEICTIGGGGGSYVVLRGLTEVNNPEKNSAIVITSDNGSKSGITRIKHGVVPPGDLFLALLAMMEDPEQRDWAKILLIDRSEEEMLRDKLFISAERKAHGIDDGLDALRSLFRVRGHLYPTSNIDLDLYAETKNGNLIVGETHLDTRGERDDFDPEDVTRSIFFNVTKPPANKRALEAIRRAEKLTIVPGSPYTSIFPNLIVGGVPQEILNCQAKLIVVMNLMATKGEDHHLDMASKWLQEFQILLGDSRFIDRYGRSRIDHIIFNNQHIDPAVVKKYEDKGQKLVTVDQDECEKLAPGVNLIEADLLDEEELDISLIRHDSIKLAYSILQAA